MPTLLAHAAVPLALGLHLGVAYSETAGHRGLTHSLAVLLALLAAARRGAREARRRTN